MNLCQESNKYRVLFQLLIIQKQLDQTMQFLVLCVFCFDRSWKKRKTFFDNCFFTFLGPKRKTCVYQVSVPIFFLHRFSLFCFWKRVHPKKKMLQFPERKYCFLRLDFNTASIIPILECQAACFFNLKH